MKIVAPFVVLLCCLSLSCGRFLRAGGPGVVQEGVTKTFDHLKDPKLKLEEHAGSFRLSEIQVWYNNSEGIVAIQASYLVKDVLVDSQLVQLGSSLSQEDSIANAPSFTVNLGESEFVESISGYYTAEGGVSVNYLSFSVRNETHTETREYGGGRMSGIVASVLGPVVSLWGQLHDSGFSQIGIYVDPTEWVRETRLLKLPLYGAGSIGATSISLRLSDPFPMTSSNPVSTQIATIIVTHTNDTLHALIIGYVTEAGAEIHSITSASPTHAITESIQLNHTSPGTADYVTSARVGFKSDTCISGLQLTVYRGHSNSTEVFTYGEVLEEASISLVEDAVVGAFFGMRSSTCINALGVYTVVPDYCSVLEAPENGAIHEAPESTLVGSMYQFRCNIGCNFNGSDIRYCTGNRTWSGDPPQCQCRIITTEFIIGLSFGIGGFLLVILAIIILVCFIAWA